MSKYDIAIYLISIYFTLRVVEILIPLPAWIKEQYQAFMIRGQQAKQSAIFKRRHNTLIIKGYEVGIVLGLALYSKDGYKAISGVGLSAISEETFRSIINKKTVSTEELEKLIR